LDARGTGTGRPLVWALLGHRTGDNNQVLALAEAVGGRVVPLRLGYNALRLLPNGVGDTGLASLDAASRARIARMGPPWPDLVIGVGQRSVPVARWIRAASGGAARIVQIGRPRCHPARLDLVVTTPQYGVPPGPGVLEMPVSLSRQTPERLAEAAAAWRGRLEGYPAPRLALVLGGSSWPYRLRPEEAGAACRALLDRAAAEGGSVLAIGSRRTPEAVARAVRGLLDAAPGRGAFLGGAEAEGAYSGLLALADELHVTADSAAMISDAAATGKPVGLVPVHAGGAGGAWLAAMRALRRADAGEGPASPPLRAAGRGWGGLVRRGLAGWPRDLWFLWQGLGQAPLPSGPAVAHRAAARVRRLLPAEAGGLRDDAPPGPGNPGGHGAP